MVEWLLIIFLMFTSMFFSAFTDAHPRVRWAIANTVGRMATDFAVSIINLLAITYQVTILCH